MSTKVCTKCNTEKSIDCFVKDKTASQGVSNRCKSCDKLYRETNKERIRSRTYLYRQSRKQKTAEYNKKYREKNKDYIASLMSNYYRINKDRVNAKTAKRRAQQNKANVSWADNDAIIGMYQLAQLFTNHGVRTHVDHIVPLQSDTVCGLHCEANLQLLPAVVNISKGNRHWPDMW